MQCAVIYFFLFVTQQLVALYSAQSKQVLWFKYTKVTLKT